MAVFYLDTSAILKRYKSEKGSDAVDEIYKNVAGVTRVTSEFTCLEFEAVASRACEGKLILEETYRAMLGAFANDLTDSISLVSLDGYILKDAIGIARTYSLRGPDAIHVA